MLKILGKIPRCHFHVACSGGSDSMVLIDFLRHYPKNDFDVIHFNHGTKYCDEAEDFVANYCKSNRLKLHVGHIKSVSKPKGLSQEEYWRNCRYEFFSKFSKKPILLAHHLNDCIETWVMTAMCGNPSLIPYANHKYNIIRPLIATPKSEIESWVKRNNLQFVTDKSNFDVNIKRNYVRHAMMEHIYKINPGIESTIKNKILKAYSSSNVKI